MTCQIYPKVRIVLVNTSHPGNIGATARAMKTMGFSNLYLVNPKHFPHEKAIELAAGADDVLANAVVTDDLVSAIGSCQFVIGTSSRTRRIPLPILNPRECAAKVSDEVTLGHEVAIIFGNERVGLENSELMQCHYQLIIPTSEDYYSLNLAAAVQIICYEFRACVLPQPALLDEYDELASGSEVDAFYGHLREVLQELNFLRPENPKRLFQRIQRLFNRRRLEKKEVQILRGILSAIQRGTFENRI